MTNTVDDYEKGFEERKIFYKLSKLDLSDEDPIFSKEKRLTWGTKGLDDELPPIEKHHLMVIVGAGGVGKCLGKGTKVRMFNGDIKKAENICVGDLVMGDDSTSRKVLSLARGKEQMYWVRQNTAMDYRVNESHILSLRKTAKNKITKKDISVRDVLQECPNFLKNNFKGYKNPIEYPVKKLSIDPYFLGLWLGDGSARDVRVTIADKKTGIIDFLYSYASQLGMKVNINSNKDVKAKSFGITTGKRGNPNHECLQKKLRLLNLLNNKHIPRDFLINSKENRSKLLAGLLDTDGYQNSKCCFDFIQKRKKLSYQIKQLADSLGFKTSIRKCKKGIKSIGFIGEYYRLTISGDFSDIPFRHHTKGEWTQLGHWGSTGISIEKDIVDNYYGFSLDGNHRFLLEDGTVTHNSTFTLDLAEKNSKLGHRVLYLSLEEEVENFVRKVCIKTAGIDKNQWRDRAERPIPQRQVDTYINKQAEIYDNENLIIASLKKGEICLDANIKNITKMIEVHDPDFVIIDNFNLVEASKYAKGNEIDDSIIKFFLTYTNKVKIPILFLHHTNKEGKIRGSEKIRDSADIALSITREIDEHASPEDNATTLISSAKDRDWGTFQAAKIFFNRGTFNDEYIEPQIVSYNKGSFLDN